MPLRDYQQDAVNELRASIARSGSAVYVLPTGGGKTVVAGEIARLAAGKGSRTLCSWSTAGSWSSRRYDTLCWRQCPGISYRGRMLGAGRPCHGRRYRSGMVQSCSAPHSCWDNG